MIDWQVTAVTVHCDAVKEEVTIIVKNDWSIKCTGFEKHAVNCKGTQCEPVAAYLKKLQTEEAERSKRTGENK